MLVAVQQDWEALEYASEELRADRVVVLAAVRQDGGALEYASEELQADREEASWEAYYRAKEACYRAKEAYYARQARDATR